MPKGKKILIVCLLVFVVLFGIFVFTRYSAFTTYVPLTGRIFSVDPQQAETIFVQNGTTGEQRLFETSEDKEMIAGQLNSLRYRFWIPTLPIAKGGWSYRIAIEADGKQYSYYFTDNDMTVNGIVYLLPGEQLTQLQQYVD